MSEAPRDQNRVPTLLAEDDVTGEVVPVKVDADGNLQVVMAGEASGDVTGPASSTDNALAVFDGTTGKLLEDSTVQLTATVLSPVTSDAVALGSGTLMWSDLFLASGSVINWNNGDITLTHSAGDLALAGGTLTLPNSGLHILDTNSTHDLIISPGSNLTADRTLTITTGDASRALTLSGNLTVSASMTLDQSVAVAGTPTFVSLATGFGAGVGFTTNSVQSRLQVGLAGSMNVTADNSAAYFQILPGTIVEAGSGTHALLAGQIINIQTVTGAAATVTNTASLYIEGAMSATVSGANYALWVDAGTTQLDGDVNIGGTLTLTNDLTVANGGTGASSQTAYAVLCGGTTATGAYQSIASVGTSGQVLTSNGAGALPTFQDAAGGGDLQTAVDTMFLTGWSGGMFDTSSTNTQITSAVAGSGTNTFRLTQTRLGQIDVVDSGGTIEGILWEDVNTIASGTNFWDLDQVLIGNFGLESTTNQDCYFGLGVNEVGSGLVNPNATSTTRHIGFYVQDGTLYASNANNTTQTRTDITSGVTLTNYNTYKIVYDAGTDIKFYVNDVLKATHTTNLPTTDSGQGFAAGCTARGTDNTKGMALSRYCYHAIKAGVVA